MSLQFIYLKVMWLAIDYHVSGRSWDQIIRSKFYVVRLGLRANSKFAPKFDIAMRAFYADVPAGTQNFPPTTVLSVVIDMSS